MWPGKKLCRSRVLAQGTLLQERVGRRSRRGLPKDREADVDEEVGAAAGDEEDTKGRDCGEWGQS